MSYVPFIGDSESIESPSSGSISPSKNNIRRRQEEQNLIKDFIEKIYGQRTSLSYEEYKHVN